MSLAADLKDFFSYYRPHQRLFLLDFGCAVVAGLLELSFPIATRHFIDQLLPTGQWGLILGAAGGLLAVYLLTAGLLAIVTYWGHMLGISIETEMRRRAFEHIQTQSFSFFDNHKTGSIVARLTKDLEEIGELAHHGPEDLFIAIMTIVGALALMFTVHPTLALLASVAMPLTLVVTGRYGGRMIQNFRALFRSLAEFNIRIEENVGGMRVVQAFANEEHEKALFAENNAAYKAVKMQGYRNLAASGVLNYLGTRLTNLLVLVAGAYFVLRGEISIGEFVGFLLLINVFFRPIEKINAVIEGFPKGMAGFKSYQELLATPPEVQNKPDASEAPPFVGEIEYRGVKFGYGDGRAALHGIDLKIEAGSTVAFVGPSGAGKTTLCALLPRFYDPSAGEICIDGRPTTDFTLSSLRHQIGSVQQDVFLFGGTLRENIAYGKLNATEEEILQAAERAQLAEVIAALPQGLDTLVGERGVKLSGGQKQRLAIARMFLKNPPILVLDEATSALDTATERAIQASLVELSRGRTTLVIAHRLATVQNADKIVVVDAGRIVEMGTHAELLALGGQYARLHAAQMF